MESKELYALFNRHFGAWTEPDRGRREAIIPDLYTPDLEVIDSHFAFEGSGNLHTFVENLQKKFPGAKFSLTRPLEHHHDLVRAFWQFGIPGQPPATTGQDMVRLKDGRIQKLFVFLDGVNIIHEPK